MADSWLVGSGPRCVAQEANHRSGSFSCSAIDARTKLGGKLRGETCDHEIETAQGQANGHLHERVTRRIMHMVLLKGACLFTWATTRTTLPTRELV